MAEKPPVRVAPDVATPSFEGFEVAPDQLVAAVMTGVFNKTWATIQAAHANTPYAKFWEDEKMKAEILADMLRENTDGYRGALFGWSKVDDKVKEATYQYYFLKFMGDLCFRMDLKVAPAGVWDTLDYGSPVFVVGFPRSGTTFFHRLLCEDYRTRGVRFYQVLAAGHFSSAKAFRRGFGEKLLAEMLKNAGGSAITDYHEMSVDMFDEDHYFESQANIDLLSFCSIPRFRAGSRNWMYNTDHTEQFKRNAYCLKLAMLDTPVDEDFDHFTLKCPMHIRYLRELMNVFPNARFVWLHRNPVACATSITHILYKYALLRQGELGVPSLQAVADIIVDDIKFTSKKAVESRRQLIAEKPERASQFIDVSFKEMNSDLPAVLKRVYEQLGWDMPQRVADAFKDFSEANKRNPRGIVYTAEEMGVNPREVEEGCKAYTDEFSKYLA